MMILHLWLQFIAGSLRSWRHLTLDRQAPLDGIFPIDSVPFKLPANSSEGTLIYVLCDLRLHHCLNPSVQYPYGGDSCVTVENWKFSEGEGESSSTTTIDDGSLYWRDSIPRGHIEPNETFALVETGCINLWGVVTLSSLWRSETIYGMVECIPPLSSQYR